MCCVFHLKNDDTVPNAMTINKFLEATSGSEMREYYNNVIIKEKKDMCININDIHEIIISVVSKQRTHT